MEKRKWLWKRKSSERSPGETESSGSLSSHSERYSDDQEAFKASPNHNTQSPEVTSKAAVNGEEISDSVKILTEKLSAALVNVSAKEDLVKQHAKVAEEAVAGWEKAENDVSVLKQQLELAIQQKLALENRVNHLDGALKECVRQLRQGREEQDQKIHEAVVEKTREWESTKVERQTQLEAVKAEPSISIDPDLPIKLESLEKENSALTFELLSQSEELEIRTIERDLSAQAAETASKQHLESIKKVAKLEAECRRLQAVARKSSLANDQKSLSASSFYVESLTDSQSDSGERLNALEIDSQKMSRLVESEKAIIKSITGSSLEIDIMDDFLEMERLAALPELETKSQRPELISDSNQFVNGENPLKVELEEMSHRVAELEEKLLKTEAEKCELEKALAASEDSFEASQVQLKQVVTRLEELMKELNAVNESKELFEFQLIGMEVEARTMALKVELLKEEVKKEHRLSAEMAVKCQELEDELTRKSQEIELQQTAVSNGKPKINQEDLDVAAGKLAECQKTIASLGRQLQSLATLEDFLTDTANLPGFSAGGSTIPGVSDLWKLHSNETFLPKNDTDPSKIPVENSSPLVNGNAEKLPPSSSSSVSLNRVSSAKSRNGFGKLFSRSKSGIQLENQQA
ncbi:filament-like plant protein isoform X1 [Actinidia eriantha]|uniref:filament-like plant protein isoform X1 n=1 Tax=Actinidia eriantha TaxID=165200 RepID=UPI00258B8AFC|nr:filament-like plant protein isoform X1 [Actinidia eriantha]XP_057470053.1 filament-like plant protein isoform X1 [Actinidia eriantha]